MPGFFAAAFDNPSKRGETARVIATWRQAGAKVRHVTAAEARQGLIEYFDARADMIAAVEHRLKGMTPLPACHKARVQ